MTKRQHKKRHEALHHALDELLADFIWHTHNLPSRTSLMTLMRWSSEQMENPSEERQVKNIMKQKYKDFTEPHKK